MNRAHFVAAEPDLDHIFGHEPEQNCSCAGSLTTRRLSEIEAKPVCWLWPGRIARGKLTIIAGNPGLGKSQITASLAAVVTTGEHWPVDRHPSKASDVIFLTAEDDVADTLRPRLEAAGADVKRVHFVEGVALGVTSNGERRNRLFSLAEDLEALSQKLSELGDVAVLVIDPISAYLGEIDSHKNADVRGLLAPLSELAACQNTAIIGISHLTKAAGEQALMRVSGSLAFVAAARAAYLVAHDQKDQTRRLFLPLKNNLGPDRSGLAYHIEGATVPSAAGLIETSRVVWEAEPVTISADEAMLSARPNVSALNHAQEWLKEVLADGPMPANDVGDLARGQGISETTLRRAREGLRIRPKKQGMAEGWIWALPATGDEAVQSATPQNTSKDAQSC